MSKAEFYFCQPALKLLWRAKTPEQIKLAKENLAVFKAAFVKLTT